MNQRKKYGIAVLIFLVLCLSGLAFDRVYAEGSNLVTITVSKEDIQNIGAAKAIQNALYEARDYGSASRPYRIRVPEGSYTLNTSLFVYSYTTLDLTRVTLTRTTATNIIYLGTRDDSYSTSGVTGYYYKDISIIGGTLNGNGLSSTIFKGAHASNVSVKGTTMQNTHNAHIMEVAGIDGLTIENCTFKDQIDDGTGSIVCYEALQLDVISNFHFANYRSEALIMKNVRITGCTFSNAPRGVGCHTGILNAPFENIVISGNRFSNMKSAGIQIFNWVNCEISNNTITDSPRGIAVYSMLEAGNGMYLASALAKEGSTATTISDSYKTPIADQNIRITNNTITLNHIKDPYAEYVRGAIIISGITNAGPTRHMDDTGNLPAGNYYISGVTVTNNTISTTGHGIRLIDARNITVSQNVIKGNIPDSDGTPYYGIQARDGSSAEVISNTIQNMNANGIYFYTDASGSIRSNTISNMGKYGIDIESASADIIEKNKIASTKNYGIYVFSGSKANSIRANTIQNTETDALRVSNSKVSTVSENQISISSGYGIYLVSGAVVNDVSSNIIHTVQLDAIKVSAAAVTTVTKNQVNGANGYGIRFSSSAQGTTVSDNMLLNVTEKAVSIASDSTVKAKQNNYSCTTPVLSSAGNVYGGVQVTWKKANGAEKYRVYRKTSGGSWTRIGETTGTSYTDTTAKGGTTYIYTVRCITSDGKDFTSSYDAKGITDKYIEAPVLTSVTTSGGGTQVRWNKVTGAVKYRIYRKTKSGSWTRVGETTGTSYMDTAVRNSTSYLYTVRCINSAGTTFTSGYYSPGYTTTPGLPVLTNTYGGVRITWKKVTAAAKYRIYRKTSGGSWTRIGETTGTSYIDTTAKSGTTYVYTIRCITSDGKSFTSSYLAGKSIQYIAAPTLTSVTTSSGGTQIKWNKVTGAVKYRVYRKTKTGSWTYVGETTGTSLMDTTAKNTTSYLYTVRCVNAAVTAFTSGYYSPGYTAAPGLPVLTNTSKGVQITWAKVTAAAKYRVYRRTASGSWTRIGETTGTSYTDTTAKSGTTYIYTIRCITSDGKNFTSSYLAGKSISRL